MNLGSRLHDYLSRETDLVAIHRATHGSRPCRPDSDYRWTKTRWTALLVAFLTGIPAAAFGGLESFGGAYSLAVDGGTAVATVSGSSITVYRPFAGGAGGVGAVNWQGTLTQSASDPNLATITGSGTVTGLANPGGGFSLSHADILIEPDGSATLTWQGYTPAGCGPLNASPCAFGAEMPRTSTAVSVSTTTTSSTTTTTLVGAPGVLPPPPPRIAAGTFYSLAVRDDGTLWGWGGNGYGELGIGTVGGINLPKQIGSEFSAVAAGASHSIALKRDGTLWTWGRNDHGQLGAGSRTDRLAPAQIGSDFVAVSAGSSHSLAVKADATLWAWGNNTNGQVGDGTNTERLAPVQIGSGFSAVAAGGSHSYALKSNGTLWGWGFNNAGQVGDGTATDRISPVQIGTGFVAIAAGSAHGLALKGDGTLWGWGNNASGQLGDGTAIGRASPIQVGSGFSAIAAGWIHSVALKGDQVWAWGSNDSGQLGDGTTTNRRAPVLIGTGYTAIAAGWHTLAAKGDGTLWAWGQGTSGQLGDGTGTDRHAPAQVGLVGKYFNLTTASGPAATTTTTTSSTTTSQVATTTTTASTTTTTVVYGGNVNLLPGWNLIGNGQSNAITVSSVFGDSSLVNTIWKWIASTGTWAFYTPTLTDGGAAYAATKGYSFLTTINAGEGFWVNAKSTFNMQLPVGTAVLSASFQSMGSGWNLIAIGDNKTPSLFNQALSATPPSPGVNPLNLTTLWAWDAALTNWYFYAPSLDSAGSLSSYITSKNYLSFGAGTLAPTTGFWVNKP